MKYVCMVPGKEKMRWYLDWIRDQLLDLNVDIRLNHAPGVEELRDFDVVLNATGAASYVPPVVGDASRVVPFEEAMACPKVSCECHPGGRKMRKLGARVLLWGDSYAAADTAAWLADIGREVTIVTENREFAADCEVIHMYVARKRFAQGDAEVLALPAVQASRDGHHVHHRGRDPRRGGRPPGQGLQPHRGRGRRHRHLPHAAGDRACSRELRAAGIHVLNVGDSVRPRNLYHAVKEGSAFGLAVDEHLLFNPNGAILDDLPIDVLAQLTREEGPSYTAKRMLEIAGINGS